MVGFAICDRFAAADIVFVKSDAAGANNGSSWVNACTTLQAGLAVSDPGDEIWVAAGTYRPDQGPGQTLGDRNATFSLRSGVALYGGFAGTESERDQRSPELHQSVLTGELQPGPKVVGVSIPQNSMNLWCWPLIHQVWSVYAPPGSALPDTSGIGFLVNQSYPLNFEEYSLHDNGTYGNQTPDPNRAVITWEFSTPQAIDQVEVVQHSNGVTQLEAFVGDDLNNLASVGEVSSPQVSEFQSSIFDFNNALAGRYLRVIIRRTWHVSAYASYRMFPRNAAGQRIPAQTGNSYNVVVANGVDHTAVIDGVVIRAGHANEDGHPVHARGGGLHIRGPNTGPTVRNCRFIANSGREGGALAILDSTSPVIEDCEFTDNSAVRGGAVYWYSTVAGEIARCKFELNHADDSGGAAHNLGIATQTYRECNFSGNTAVGHGGAMFGASLRSVVLCDFRNNEASGDGGGLYAQPNGCNVLSCHFLSNRASRGGGVCANVPLSSITIGNSRFVGNLAQGNQAGYGGGAIAVVGPAQNQYGSVVHNCTLVANNAAWDGGALLVSQQRVRVYNSVLWDNQAGQGHDVQLWQAPFSLFSYSLIEGGQDGVGIYPPGGVPTFDHIIGSDPQFRDVLGPDAQPGTGDEDHRLQSLSPCIDAGRNDQVPSDAGDLDSDGVVAEWVPFDLGGGLRFADLRSVADEGLGNPPLVDIGAYEYPRFFPGDLDHDGDIDADDAAMFMDCMTGPDVAQNEPQCQDAKLDGDDDVDLGDFGLLQLCFSGAGVPAVSGCSGLAISISDDPDFCVSPGESASLAVSLSRPAPATGVTINFTSSDTNIATITPSVHVPPGSYVPDLNPEVTGVTLGMVQVDATAQGYEGASRTVEVGFTLSFSPNPFTVLRGDTAPITLYTSKPAPPGGLVVGLMLVPSNGTVTVPATATIPGHKSSVQIPVTGIANGSTSLKTNVAGIPEASASINVVTGAISLSGTTVGRDMQICLPWTLTLPAPSTGLAITVSSADPTRVQLALDEQEPGVGLLEVFVPGGSREPPTLFVRGLVDAGTVQVTAQSSSPLFSDGSATVALAPSGFVFTASSIPDLIPGQAHDLEVRMAALDLGGAPRGDQNYQCGFGQPNSSARPRPGLQVEVPVTSGTLSVGTIAISPLVFQVTQYELHTTFQALAVGASVVSVGVPDGYAIPTAPYRQLTATVVDPAPVRSLTIPNINVGEDLQRPLLITISAAPEPFTITLSSSNPNVVRVAGSPTEVGSSSIAIPVSANMLATVAFIQGWLQDNSATLTVSAPGYQGDTAFVNVDESGFVFRPTNPVPSIGVCADSVPIEVMPRRVSGTTVPSPDEIGTTLRGGLSPVSVTVSSSNPAVGAILESPLIFQPSVGSMSVVYNPLSVGTTTLQVVAPPGFEQPANRRTYSSSVTGPVAPTELVKVGVDAQVFSLLALSGAPSAPVDVTVTIGNPGIATLSLAPGDIGSASVVFGSVATEQVGAVFVNGIGIGNTTLTVSAPGYPACPINVQVTPSGFIFLCDDTVDTTTFRANSPLAVGLVRLNASGAPVSDCPPGPCSFGCTTNCWCLQPLRPGVSAVVPVSNSDPIVGAALPHELHFEAGDASLFLEFDPGTVGSTTLELGVPEGFGLPTSRRSVVATVRAPRIIAPPDIDVGQNLQQAVVFQLEDPPPQPVDVVVASQTPTCALVSPFATQPGSPAITYADVADIGPRSFFAQNLLRENVGIRLTAPGYQDGTVLLVAHPTGFILSSPVLDDFTLPADAADVPLLISPVPLDRVTLNPCLNPADDTSILPQSLRAGFGSQQVEVYVVNEAAATAAPRFLTFTGGESAFQPSMLNLVAPGVTDLIVATPAGFDTPSRYRQIRISVLP